MSPPGGFARSDLWPPVVPLLCCARIRYSACTGTTARTSVVLCTQDLRTYRWVWTPPANADATQLFLGGPSSAVPSCPVHGGVPHGAFSPGVARRVPFGSPRVSRGLSKFPNRLRYFFLFPSQGFFRQQIFLKEVESNKQKLWWAIAQINYTKCRIKPFENDHFPIDLWARFGLYINKDRETKDETGGSKNPIPKGFQRIFHWLLNFTTNLSQNPRILDTLKIRPLIINFSYLL